jgi:extracellular factor (EF) 3-hydroxypalmitic acid methyl ester biosynthesis protein
MEAKPDRTPNGEQGGFVVGQNSHGLEIQGTLLRFNRHVAVFEIYTPAVILRMSEVLSGFRILFHERAIYSGRAVVRSLINTGAILVCEVTLEDGWIDLQPRSDNGQNAWSAEFNQFLLGWQKNYRVAPEFKVVVADMQSLLTDMRLWLEQVELTIRASPNGERLEMEKDAAGELAPSVLAAMDSLGDRFEEIASRLEPDLRPVHINFTKRHLHPLLLCSPFAYRTYHKPLGYAGDYEMVNMIMRGPFEGASLFAKVVNAWFHNQLPAQAHRNRIDLLKKMLVEETLRAAARGRSARIFNVGCGPAGEIQEFLAGSDLADQAEFTLLDFNEETLQYAAGVLQKARQRFGRRTPFQLQKKSVAQLLKEAARPGGGGGKYDLVYCAGLFDYLSDRVCKQLLGLLYQWLAPGGLLLVTNVDCTRPFRNKLEFILDWNLIYRQGRDLAALRPDFVPADRCAVKADLTSVNVFMEIRKPEHA